MIEYCDDEFQCALKADQLQSLVVYRCSVFILITKPDDVRKHISQC